MSTSVEKPKRVELEKRAESEAGRLIEHTDGEVDRTLRLLAINGGSIKDTCAQLEEAGASIHRNTLSKWRNNLFPKRYAKIRGELGKEISADLAGRAFETALQADAAVKTYVERAVQKIDEVEPHHLAKGAQSLSMVHANAIEKARLLRNEPDHIQETRSVDELVAVLVRSGVVEDDGIEAEVIDEHSS